MKLFISQPMRGKTDDEIGRERTEAILNACKILHQEKSNVDVIDSFFEGAPADAKPLWFLGKSLQKLADADVAYFCRDWDKYRGCCIEEICAKQYGIKTIYHTDL